MEIIFDGDCGICRASVDWLDRRDASHIITARESWTLDASEAEGLPIDKTVIVRTADGLTLLRSSAVAAALSVLPGLWGATGRRLSRALRFSPLHFIGDASYDLVAHNRVLISRGLVRFGLIEEACRVPSDHG